MTHPHEEHCTCGHDHEHHHDEHCTCGHDHGHHHDEHCTCGHDHGHHHDEHCTCGHDHEHHHDEHCSCGHDHEHHHDEHCSCGHDHHEPGQICIQVALHDDAKVVSGRLELVGDYTAIREGLRRGMEEFAAGVDRLGGVVGHIKASVHHAQVEMFSVTDLDVMVKTAPEEQVFIVLAAIVFYITEEQALALGRKALEQACGTA